VRARSGSRLLDRLTYQALFERSQRRGATYAMSDWHGNEFTVFISKFGPHSADGQSFADEMELLVREAPRLAWPYTDADVGGPRA